MSYEARIFFPLPDADQQDDAVGSASSAGASNTAAASPFSLFDASDFRHFHPTDDAPTDAANDKAEHRSDLYLIDESLSDMASYGLKLRGTDASGSSHVANGKQEMQYKLELKIRLKATVADQEDQEDQDEGEGTDGEAVTQGGGVTLAEEWKKVIKHTNIRCTFDGLVGAILPAVSHANTAAKLTFKRRSARLLVHMQHALQAHKEAGEGCPFRIVAVDKRRCKIARYEAEQTDVDVSLVDRTSGDAGGVGKRRVQRYRSICFEGTRADMQSPHIHALFAHLLQRYGDERMKEKQAQPNGASSSSAIGSRGALVAGYPEFLQRILPQL